MEELKYKIRVYCGETVLTNDNESSHPVKQVLRVKNIVKRVQDLKLVNYDCWSNSPDFVSGMKYLCEKVGIEVEFFLNGVSYGADIEPIFADFNRALDMINDIIESDDKSVNF